MTSSKPGVTDGDMVTETTSTNSTLTPATCATPYPTIHQRQGVPSQDSTTSSEGLHLLPAKRANAAYVTMDRSFQRYPGFYTSDMSQIRAEREPVPTTFGEVVVTVDVIETVPAWQPSRPRQRLRAARQKK